MQPPPPIDFISNEAVRQFYAAMPTVFARDIARAKGQLIPPQSIPTLKRERPADGPELAVKRRDTGESKAGTGMPPPATPSLASKSVPISTQSFPPQGAMPDRTRMAQMRQQQAPLQTQAPPTQQPPASAGVRQMSPPQSTNAAGVGIGVGFGQPQGQGQGQGQTAAIQQVVNAFGQQGLVLVQQLQDPNNVFVKYMVEQIPNFMTLPLQQQVESMQQAQVCTTYIYAFPSLLTIMLPSAHDSAETTCAATHAAAAANSTATTIAAATAAAAAATSAAVGTTTTTSTNATTAAQSPATTAAKHGQSQPGRAGRSHTVTAANDHPVTK